MVKSDMFPYYWNMRVRVSLLIALAIFVYGCGGGGSSVSAIPPAANRNFVPSSPTVSSAPTSTPSPKSSHAPTPTPSPTRTPTPTPVPTPSPISMRHVLTYFYLDVVGAPSSPFGQYAPYVDWAMSKASDGNALSAAGIKVFLYTNPNREYTTDPLYTSDESTFAHTCSGARITTSDGAYLMNPASTNLWSLWKNLINSYQAQGHVDAFETDDANDLYGVSATPCGYTAASWLASTISEDAYVGAPVVYNGLGLFSWDKVAPDIALNPTATGGLLENCYAEGWNPPFLPEGD